jgi:hypothetical protein
VKAPTVKIPAGLGVALPFLLATIAATAADSPCDAPCRKPTSWFDFNAFTLVVSDPSSRNLAEWSGWWGAESKDMRIEAKTSGDAIKKSGSIVLVAGRVMAVKGDVAETGYEIDALDGAVLQEKLVLILLGAALPNGPKSVHGNQSVDYSEAMTGIQFATPSAEGFIAPPWRVTGSVQLIATDEFEYRLALTSGTKAKATEQSTFFAATYFGRLSKNAHAKLDDSMGLEGWRVLGLGIQTKKTGGGESFDYSAAPTGEVYRTVADIRKKIAADEDPGVPDSTKDFAGFWKTKCEDAFGESIEHFGTGGLYSMVFCGPGGCGNVDEARKTYITGDKHFEVVSQDEYIEIGNGGERHRSVRCSKDPRPVLKYKSSGS